MLKAIEVPQPLDLRVVNLVFTRRPRMTKLSTTHEIDMDGHLVPLGIQIDLLNEPPPANAQRLPRQFFDRIGHFASAKLANGPTEAVSQSSQPTSRSVDGVEQ
jgi:hypothetical protein